MEPSGCANFRRISLFGESIRNGELIFREYLWDIHRSGGVRALRLVNGLDPQSDQWNIRLLIKRLYGLYIYIYMD